MCVCAVSCSAFVLFSGVDDLLLWGYAELCLVISKKDILAKFGLGSRLRSMDVCVCFLPIHSGHQVRWTYQPGSHRRKVTQDF